MKINTTYFDHDNYEDELIHGVDTECIFEDKVESSNVNKNNLSYKRPPLNGLKMSWDQWLSLSKSEQLAWDTILNKS